MTAHLTKTRVIQYDWVVSMPDKHNFYFRNKDVMNAVIYLLICKFKHFWDDR